MNHVLEFNEYISEQTLYHGTAHRFDAFSTDFMGKGEGVQAEGWGIYLSASEDKARTYSLAGCAPSQFAIEPHIIGVDLTATQQQILQEVILDAAKHRANISHKGKFVDNRPIQNRLEKRTDTDSRYLLGLLHKYEVIHLLKMVGNVYTVKVADNAKWFEFDNPLTESMLAVMREAIAAVDPSLVDHRKSEYLIRLLKFGNVTDHKGMHMYGCIADYLGSNRAASLFLCNLGYTGIAFKSAGTFCYIVFKAKDLQIVRVEEVE